MDLKEIREIIRGRRNDLDDISARVLGGDTDSVWLYNKVNCIADSLSVLYYNIELWEKKDIPL